MSGDKCRLLSQQYLISSYCRHDGTRGLIPISPYIGTMNNMYTVRNVNELLGELNKNTTLGDSNVLKALFPVVPKDKKSKRRRQLDTLMPSTLDLIMSMSTILEQRRKAKSIIVTGRAGAGKTFILQQMAMNADDLPCTDYSLNFSSFNSKLFSSILKSMSSEDGDAFTSTRLPRILQGLNVHDKKENRKNVIILNNYKIAEMIAAVAPSTRMILELPKSILQNFISNNPDIIGRFEIFDLDDHAPSWRELNDELMYVEKHVLEEYYKSVLTEKQVSTFMEEATNSCLDPNDVKTLKEHDFRDAIVTIPIGDYIDMLEKLHVELDQVGKYKPGSVAFRNHMKNVLMTRSDLLTYDDSIMLSSASQDAGHLKIISSIDDEDMAKLFGMNEDQVNDLEGHQSGSGDDHEDDLEYRDISTLGDRLKTKVIGQDDAVDSLVESIKIDAAGVSDKTRPIGVFLFEGPSGVGKTELAKRLAEELFTKPVNLIRLDMSEYATEESSSKLFGISPGYVGYDAGGQLTNKVKSNPHSVILLDEVEKAHRNIWNSFLQVFDDGRMTDNTGEVVDFTNTIIIMTSNLGTASMFKTHTGFGERSDDTFEHEMRSAVKKATDKYFTPEMQNRIDAMIVFHPLSKDTLKNIVGLQLDKINDRLRSSHKMSLDLKLDADMMSWILNESESREYGARKLDRVIRKHITEPLADWLIAHDKKYTGNDILHMTYDKTGPAFKVTKTRRKKAING